MEFVIRLEVSSHWKSKTYYSILVIINLHTKIIHYEQEKIIVNALNLIKVIIDVIVKHNHLPNLFLIDCS